jgi:hypothetical protein
MIVPQSLHFVSDIGAPGLRSHFQRARRGLMLRSLFAISVFFGDAITSPFPKR